MDAHKLLLELTEIHRACMTHMIDTHRIVVRLTKDERKAVAEYMGCEIATVDPESIDRLIGFDVMVETEGSIDVEETARLDHFRAVAADLRARERSRMESRVDGTGEQDQEAPT